MEVHERWAHVCSATPDGCHPVVHVLLIVPWSGHPPRKLLETMGGSATQPRLDHTISKQVSAWHRHLFSKPPIHALCSNSHGIPSTMSHFLLPEMAHLGAVPLHKQHLFGMNPKSFSKGQLCKAPVKK